MKSGESPLECIIREYYEETGLTLVEPRLQGISYLKNSKEGIIFIYTAEEFKGNLTRLSAEGILEWINIEDLANIKQFEQNKKFMPYLFKNKLFEGKFSLGEQCEVLDYKIRTI